MKIIVNDTTDKSSVYNGQKSSGRKQPGTWAVKMAYDKGTSCQACPLEFDP